MFMATLVLINGAPGSGKSTLARLLVDERPLSLLLDIDTLRGQLGQWSADPQAAGLAARRLALAMIGTHLVEGLDVVVPQFLFRMPFILELEQVAVESGARFVEIALVSSPEEAAARFAARAESSDSNHQDAVRLQQAAGAQPIEELYAALVEMLRGRPATQFVESAPGDIAGTFAIVRRIVDEVEQPESAAW
jgi:predicted kinase